MVYCLVVNVYQLKYIWMRAKIYQHLRKVVRIVVNTFIFNL